MNFFLLFSPQLRFLLNEALECWQREISDVTALECWLAADRFYHLRMTFRQGYSAQYLFRQYDFEQLRLVLDQTRLHTLHVERPHQKSTAHRLAAVRLQ